MDNKKVEIDFAQTVKLPHFFDRYRRYKDLEGFPQGKAILDLSLLDRIGVTDEEACVYFDDLEISKQNLELINVPDIYLLDFLLKNKRYIPESWKSEEHRNTYFAGTIVWHRGNPHFPSIEWIGGSKWQWQGYPLDTYVWNRRARFCTLPFSAIKVL